MKLSFSSGPRSGKLVAELTGVAKSFGGKPVVKDLERFSFEGTPINEEMIRSLHDGSFLPPRRNIVLVGGTGTGVIGRAILRKSGL